MAAFEEGWEVAEARAGACICGPFDPYGLCILGAAGRIARFARGNAEARRSLLPPFGHFAHRDCRLTGSEETKRWPKSSIPPGAKPRC